MNRTHPNFNKPDEESSDTLSTNLPYSSYNSFGTVSPPLTGSPVHDNDSVSDNSKKIRKKRNTYQKIDDGTRMKLLDAVQQGETLKAAAKRYGINYSSAKSILHTYRKEGRILKKSAQERIARKRTKTSSDLEMSPIYPYKEYQGFDCAPENQAYGSMDFQQRIDLPIINCLGDEGHMRTVAPNGMTINSLGGFKIDSEGRNKSENNNLTSSIAIKLDSQSYQAVPTHINNNAPTSIPMLNPTVQNSRNIQSGSWQLNVNVRNDNSQKNGVKPVVNAREEPRFTYNFTTTRAPEHHKDPEPCYMNYSNAAPQVHQTRPRREVPAEYDPSYLNRRYDGVNDMINTNVANEEHYPSEGQNYDVSCFLNSSSPAYTFQPRVNEMDYNQMGGMQGYPGTASLRGY